ncbi:M23 family metallopeptidase [Tsuneonella sp. HG222]
MKPAAALCLFPILAASSPAFAEEESGASTLPVAALVSVKPATRSGVPDAAFLAASAGQDAPVSITVGRAADLVGQPFDIVAYSRAARQLAAGPGGGVPGEMPTLAPTAYSRITSGFGTRRHPILGTLRSHSGIDLAAPTGTPIRATADGVVSVANWKGGYGLFVGLKHAGGLESNYGHMSRLNVSAGQKVTRGQVIGYVGSTGMSTGPHVHYEVRMNGRAVDPAKAMKRP